MYSALYPIEHGDAFPNDDEWVVRYLDKRNRAYIQPWIEYNDNFENQLSRSYHYTFGDYVTAIVQAGLKIQELREPMPSEVWRATAFGRYDSYIETPTYMILSCQSSHFLADIFALTMSVKNYSMVIDLKQRDVLRRNKKRELTYTEFGILQRLAQNPGRVSNKE